MSTWAYKVTSQNSVNIYHTLLPKIDLKLFCKIISDAQEIFKEKDGSVTIVLEPSFSLHETVKELSSLFNEIENANIDTRHHYYTVSTSIKKKLYEWHLSFEGCLGVLISQDEKLRNFFLSDWQYINSATGGLFIEPYTIFLFDTFAKVIHPTTLRNVDIREVIEERIALFITQIAKRVEDAQPGFEGLAMISLVEDKTNLKANQIVKTVNIKSNSVVAPIRSPFFSLAVDLRGFEPLTSSM